MSHSNLTAAHPHTTQRVKPHGARTEQTEPQTQAFETPQPLGYHKQTVATSSNESQKQASYS